MTYQQSVSFIGIQQIVGLSENEKISWYSWWTYGIWDSTDHFLVFVSLINGRNLTWTYTHNIPLELPHSALKTQTHTQRERIPLKFLHVHSQTHSLKVYHVRKAWGLVLSWFMSYYKRLPWKSNFRHIFCKITQASLFLSQVWHSVYIYYCSGENSVVSAYFTW